MKACYCTLAGTSACYSCSNYLDDFVYRPMPVFREYPQKAIEISLVREVRELKEAIRKLMEDKKEKAE